MNIVLVFTIVIVLLSSICPSLNAESVQSLFAKVKAFETRVGSTTYISSWRVPLTVKSAKDLASTSSLEVKVETSKLPAGQDANGCGHSAACILLLPSMAYNRIKGAFFAPDYQVVSAVDGQTVVWKGFYTLESEALVFFQHKQDRFFTQELLVFPDKVVVVKSGQSLRDDYSFQNNYNEALGRQSDNEKYTALLLEAMTHYPSEFLSTASEAIRLNRVVSSSELKVFDLACLSLPADAKGYLKLTRVSRLNANEAHKDYIVSCFAKKGTEAKGVMSLFSDDEKQYWSKRLIDGYCKKPQNFTVSHFSASSLSAINYMTGESDRDFEFYCK